MSSETVHTDPECQSNKLNQAKCGSKTTSQFTYVLQLVHSHTLNWYLCILYADAQVILVLVQLKYLYIHFAHAVHMVFINIAQYQCWAWSNCQQKHQRFVLTLPTSQFAYSHFAYVSFCLHVSFCLQMCIISPTYGYDLEGLSRDNTD